MSHQMDSKNGCNGRYSFRVFGRNLFNRMMNRFESRWFIAIIGEESGHIYFSAAEQIFPSLQRINKINFFFFFFCKIFFLLLMINIF